MGDAYSAVAGSPEAPWFHEVLDAIGQFELASIGLIAWEHFLGEEELVPAFRQATDSGLIERVGRCPYTREPMYRLTDPPPPAHARDPALSLSVVRDEAPLLI